MAVGAPRAGTIGAAIPITFQQDAQGVWAARGGQLRARVEASGLTLWQAGQGLNVAYEGRSAAAQVEGGVASAGRVNLLLGRTAAEWVTDQAAYESLSVRGLYAGIDLRLSGAGGTLKSEYLVGVGAEPEMIRIRYAPAYEVRVEADGSLRIETKAGVWREAAPLLYQEQKGRSEIVEGQYKVLGDGTVGFAVGPYDRSRPLVIDPVMTFSSVLGGTGSTAGTAVAVDAAGYLYVAGYTDAANLPVQGAASPRVSGVDAYVAKIQASTGRLIYATYLGGSGDDRAFALAVDSLGSAYLAGWTTSTNFPVASAAQGVISGYKDAFLVKLNPAGSGFGFSTYFGGTGSESANAIALTATQLWLGGDSSSASLPVGNGWRNSNGGKQDGFLARYSQSGSLQMSTLLGGGGDDSVKAVAVDSQGNVLAAGATGSSNMGFPMGGLQSTLKGSQDAFVVMFDATCVQMIAGTYLGGTRGDVANPEMALGMAVDTSRNVYVTGMTPSSDFPLVSAWSSILGGMQDAFVAKLNSGLSAVTWSTLVGGTGKDSGTCIGLDASGAVVVGGSTTSTGFPVQGATQTANGGGSDGFVVRLAANGAAALFSTYVGGTAAEGVAALTLGPAGTIYVAGQSGSGDYPQKNPAQAVTGGALRLFATRFAVGTVPTLQAVSPGAGSGAAQAFTFSATHVSGATQIGSLELLIGPSPGSAQVCRVRYDRSTGLLGVAADSGQTWSTVVVGGGSAAGNSQCTLSGTGSSVVSAGNTLTVTAPISFAAGFAGAWGLFLNASAVSGEETGFAPAGAYTAVPMTNQAPVASLVTPSSGSGLSGKFSFLFSDANGGADITMARAIVHTSTTDAQSCSVRVTPATGLIELASDAGSGWSSAVAGSAQTLQNSQCQVKLAGSSLAVSGSMLTVVLDLAFQAAFAGARTVYGMATDAGGVSGPWKQIGTWTVPGTVVNVAPVAAQASPASGSGDGRSFTFTFTDANGGADIAMARVLINAQQTAYSGCYFAVDRATGVIWLADDAGSGWAASAHVGVAESAGNSQCTVQGAGASLSVSGSTLTLTVTVQFLSGFNGVKNVYTNATDAGGLTSESPKLGTYTVEVAGGQPTGPLSVSPSSGSGASQVFTFTFADPRGAADLTWLRVLIHSQQTAVAGCYLEVDPVGLVAYLYDDAGSGYSAVRLGTSDTAQNGQCRVSGNGSSVSLSGTTATLLLSLSFEGGFAGARSIWANASDRSGYTSSSPLLGSYAVSLPAGQALGPVSVAPASGSGAAQSFTFLFADPKGATDLAWMRVLIHSRQTAAQACYLAVERATGLVYLADDSGVNWLTARIGSSDVAKNTQCGVSGASSSVTLSGNSATVVLALSFFASFNGTKTVWANATDASGATSASPPVGTYTVVATGGNQAPVPVLVTPASGSGPRQVFTVTFSDPNGGADIETPRVLIHSRQAAESGCYFQLTASTGVLSLANDAGAAWSQARLGVNESAQNSQCVLYGATSTAVVEGNSLVLNVDVGFKSSFTGAKSVWANATDLGGLTSDSPLLGLYTVTP